MSCENHMSQSSTFSVVLALHVRTQFFSKLEHFLYTACFSKPILVVSLSLALSLRAEGVTRPGVVPPGLRHCKLTPVTPVHPFFRQDGEDKAQGPEDPVVCQGRGAYQSDRRGSSLLACPLSSANSVLHGGVEGKGEDEQG